VGEYHQGLPNGEGKYEWSTGDTYVGQFKQGLKHGRGKWKQQSSEREGPSKFNSYDGEYLDDLKHGFGVF
jgi:hypothetical protein